MWGCNYIGSGILKYKILNPETRIWLPMNSLNKGPAGILDTNITGIKSKGSIGMKSKKKKSS
jgi:hypothetical protein